MSWCREYRVVWRREGLRRRTVIRQTRTGAERFALVLQGRLAEVSGHTPEELVCCSGYDCACRGVTWGEEWVRQTKGVPPLVEGPHIESREVGEWIAASSRVAAREGEDE